MRQKVTVVGGGFVGSTTAQRIVDSGLADVVLGAYRVLRQKQILRERRQGTIEKELFSPVIIPRGRGKDFDNDCGVS